MGNVLALGVSSGSSCLLHTQTSARAGAPANTVSLVQQLGGALVFGGIRMQNSLQLSSDTSTASLTSNGLSKGNIWQLMSLHPSEKHACRAVVW